MADQATQSKVLSTTTKEIVIVDAFKYISKKGKDQGEEMIGLTYMDFWKPSTYFLRYDVAKKILPIIPSDEKNKVNWLFGVKLQVNTTISAL